MSINVKMKKTRNEKYEKLNIFNDLYLIVAFKIKNI